MLKTPCEEIVWYVLPAIRAELTRALVLHYSMRHKDVAKMLDITDAAVSQYLSGKRGGQFTDPELLAFIDDIAGRLYRKEIDPSPEILCEICKKVRESPDYFKLVSKGISCGI